MCAKIIKVSVSSCCLVCCLRRSTKNRLDIGTKLPFLALQAVSARSGLKALSGQGRVLRAICTAAVLTGFACDRREAKCRTAVSSPPLQHFPTEVYFI